jgi:hypothetical protein
MSYTHLSKLDLQQFTNVYYLVLIEYHLNTPRFLYNAKKKLQACFTLF